MNKKDILIGVFFLIAALLCISAILTEGFKSYYITGIILFAFISSLFFRKANGRK